MNRETRDVEILLGDKKIVVQIYTYLTGREKHDMTKIMASKGSFGASSDVQGEALMDAQDFLLKTCIVSLDGVAENAMENIMKLPSDVYDVVLKEINTVFAEQKKS